MKKFLDNWKNHRIEGDDDGVNKMINQHLAIHHGTNPFIEKFGVYLGGREKDMLHGPVYDDASILNSFYPNKSDKRTVSFFAYFEHSLFSQLFLDQPGTEYSNLIHEIAHAIQYFLFKGNDWETFEKLRADLLDAVINHQEENFPKGKDTIPSEIDYALSDKYELFAVTAETLFGQPFPGSRRQSFWFKSYYESRYMLDIIYNHNPRDSEKIEKLLGEIVHMVLKTFGATDVEFKSVSKSQRAEAVKKLADFSFI